MNVCMQHLEHALAAGTTLEVSNVVPTSSVQPLFISNALVTLSLSLSPFSLEHVRNVSAMPPGDGVHNSPCLRRYVGR